MTDSPKAGGRPPVQIYVIRHGEKAADPTTPTATPPPPFGVDVNGEQNIHSLLPRGWQRSGALTLLFAPAAGPPQAGLQTPTTLFSPDYGNAGRTQVHRTYQTIEGLSDRLGIPIGCPFGEGQEPALAAAILTDCTGVVLISWEHHHVPAIAAALPTVAETQIPAAWPDDRFDLIWSFTLDTSSPEAQYRFAQIRQQLLAGDTDTTI